MFDTIEFFVSGMFVDSILRGILVFLDMIVYSLTSYFYYLFLDVTEMSFLSQTDISELYQRIYVLVAVIMLFKLAFSFLQFVAEPEKFTDSKAGFAKTVNRALITIAMLALVPYAFQFAYKVQTAILRESIIPNIIIGAGSGDTPIDMKTSSGLKMSIITLTAFYRPNLECTDSKDLFDKYNDAIVNMDIGTLGLLSKDTCKVDGKQVFFIKYFPIVSTAVGLFMAYMFLVFSYDVGMRAAKLIFLQLIAPIPIIAYIDPKTADKTFKSWLTALTNTYLDVFVRIASVYFILFIISRSIKEVVIPVINPGTLTAIANIRFPMIAFYEAGTDNLALAQFNPFTYIMLIMILLQFAKAFPKWIFTVLGIKPPEGGFTLDLSKKILDTPLFGKLAGGVLGGVSNAMTGGDFSKGFASGTKNVGWLGGDPTKGGGMAFMKHMPAQFGDTSKKAKTAARAKAFYDKWRKDNSENTAFFKADGSLTKEGKIQLKADNVAALIGSEAGNKVLEALKSQNIVKDNLDKLKEINFVNKRLEKEGRINEVQFAGKFGAEALRELESTIENTAKSIQSFDDRIEKITNMPGRESVNETYKEISSLMGQATAEVSISEDSMNKLNADKARIDAISNADVEEILARRNSSVAGNSSGSDNISSSDQIARNAAADSSAKAIEEAMKNLTESMNSLSSEFKNIARSYQRGIESGDENAREIANAIKNKPNDFEKY